MCLACEMFWMVAEEPAPAPKRRPRKAKAKAKAQPETSFACDAPAVRTDKARKRKPGPTRRRAARIQSERRP